MLKYTREGLIKLQMAAVLFLKKSNLSNHQVSNSKPSDTVRGKIKAKGTLRSADLGFEITMAPMKQRHPTRFKMKTMDKIHFEMINQHENGARYPMKRQLKSNEREGEKVPRYGHTNDGVRLIRCLYNLQHLKLGLVVEAVLLLLA